MRDPERKVNGLKPAEKTTCWQTLSALYSHMQMSDNFSLNLSRQNRGYRHLCANNPG
jgi:hypothetical protein